MIAYKATYNFKCLTLTYEIGKTYTISQIEMCLSGFHFCKNMKDVLRYYSPNKDFKLLEVEILGDVIDEGDKSITNKLRVLREIPLSEHKLFETDSNNNVTKISNMILIFQNTPISTHIMLKLFR